MDGEIRAITLKCSNCGSNLEISPDMTQFACGYCGSLLVVERKGGTVALKKVVDAVEKVQIGTDKTAAELAIARLSTDLANVQAKAKAIADASDKEVSGTSSRQTKGCLLFGVFFVLFAIMALGFLPSDEKGVFGGLLTVTILIAIIGGLVTRSYNSSMKSARVRKDQALAPLLKEIADIQAKIAKQKEIVDK